MNEKPTVERIQLPAKNDFFTDYLALARPVVVQDFFSDDPIRDIQTSEQALEAWGDEKFRIRPEYVERFMSNRGVSELPPEPIQHLSLSEYLDFTKSQPDTRLLCTEEPLTEIVRKSFRLPEQVESLIDPPITQMFFGNRGNHAHLHFDGDCRHGLLYQVYGRKRILLVSPKMQSRMMPLGLVSGWFINRLSQSERTALTDFLEGTWVTINPGEALLIPAFTSHFIEYVDDAMSISVDFGRNPMTRRLHDEFPHTRHLQLVGSHLLDAEHTERLHPGFEKELETLCYSLPRDPEVRREALRRMAARLHGETTESSRLEELFLASQRPPESQ
ncbi:cupin-like domain-containing protein [Myxococcota bacterium]|nr:cupin-like domain-containing protein [Myxococcota bacterium]